MQKKTDNVQQLVNKVLKMVTKPYNEDIIEDVFLTIEKDPNLFLLYKQSCEILGKDVVNVWIAKYTKSYTGLNSGEIKTAKRSALIHSYTKLINP